MILIGFKKALKVLGLILISSLLYAAPPLTWNKSGTATTSNATITAPFNPISVCIKNTGGTNNLWVDWTDGVATTDDDSTNVLFGPGIEYCFDFISQNVNDTFTIGVISSASTTTYKVLALRAR